VAIGVAVVRKRVLENKKKGSQLQRADVELISRPFKKNRDVSDTFVSHTHQIHFLFHFFSLDFFSLECHFFPHFFFTFFSLDLSPFQERPRRDCYDARDPIKKAKKNEKMKKKNR